MTDNWDSLPASLELDNPLWHYALAAWRSTEVEHACLELQARHWCVSRILIAAWLGTLGRRYDGEAEPVRQWREQVTGILRTTRQQIPRQQPALSPLRKQLASAELEAERVELALAYESLKRPGKTDSNGPAQPDLTRNNLLTVSPTPNFDLETERLVDALLRHLPPDSFNGADTP